MEWSASSSVPPQRVQGPIGAFAANPPEVKIEQNLPQITKLFASDRLEEVLATLEADESDWALTELGTLRTKSPQSCKVALRQLHDSLECKDFAENMAMEMRIASRVI